MSKNYQQSKIQIWYYWNRLIKHYQKRKQSYYALSLSCLFHAMLLMLATLLLQKADHSNFYTIPVQIETTTSADMPDVMPQKQPLNEENTDINSGLTHSQKPLPIPFGDPNTEEIEPLATPEDWKRELSEWVTQENFDPQPILDKEPNESLENLKQQEQEIAKQIANREKQTTAMSETLYKKGAITGAYLQQIRSQGRGTLVEKGGGNPATETAVMAGLDWLARHQSSNGSWSCRNFTQCCQQGQPCSGAGCQWGDPAITGFALLCFFGIGANDVEGKYSQTVSKGLNYLLQIQTEDGCFGPKHSNYMYNHSIATIAMIEGSMMSRKKKYHQSACSAVQFLLAAQNQGLAWRYTSQCGDNDTSVTGWCMLALKAGQFAEIKVPPTAIEGGKRWLDKVTMAGEVPWVGYMSPIDRSQQPCMTAVGTLCRILFQEKQDTSKILGGGQILSNFLPEWQDRPYSNDFYYWYYGTLAMYQLGGKNWELWNSALQKTLLTSQEKNGCVAGSWNNGLYTDGGRVFWTCLAILSLQVYYRYPKVFKK